MNGTGIRARFLKTYVLSATLGLFFTAPAGQAGDAPAATIQAVPTLAAAGPTKKSVVDAGTALQGTDNAQPIASGAQVTVDLQSAIEAAKQTRSDYLKKQQDLRNNLENASEEARTKMRDQLQKTHQEFLEAQREAHEDLKRQVSQLKAQLQQHHDLIDDAKSEAKEKLHLRKDG